MYLKWVNYSYPIDKLIHTLPKWVKASYYFGGACDTSQKSFTYLPLKNTSLLKVVQPPPSILHGTLETQARNSIFSIFDPFLFSAYLISPLLRIGLMM